MKVMGGKVITVSRAKRSMKRQVRRKEEKKLADL